MSISEVTRQAVWKERAIYVNTVIYSGSWPDQVPPGS